MQILVKSLIGKTIALQVDPSDTILDIKKKIFEREGIPVEQQRLIFNAFQHEDFVQLRSCGVQNFSTFHLVLKLRGNGDMMKNHIKSMHPLENEENVNLDSCVSVTLDDSISLVDHSKLFKVEVKKTGQEIEGTTIFDSQAKTAGFISQTILPSNEEINVTVNAGSTQNQAGSLHYDYSWKFRTKDLKPIRVFLKVKEDKNDNTKKAILLDRQSGALYSELLAKISTKLRVKVEELDSIYFESTDIAIENNVDALQVNDCEVLDVVLKK